MSNTHDYTYRIWGHNYSVIAIKDGGHELRLAGWGSGICDGDFVILKNNDSTSRYYLETVEYQRDPLDMWFADAWFAPRPAVQ